MNRSISILVVPAVLVLGCSKAESAPVGSTTTAPPTPASVAPLPPVAPPSAPPSVAVADCSYKTKLSCQTKCDGGDQRACMWYGQAIAEAADRDVPKRELGISILKKACSSSLPRACVHAALQERTLVIKKSKRAPDDSEKAAFAAAISKACDGKDGFACYKYATLLNEGFGVEKNEAKAKVLHEKAMKMMAAECDAGDIEICFTLGILFHGVKPPLLTVPEDPKKVKQYFTIACEGGEEVACKELKATPEK